MQPKKGKNKKALIGSNPTKFFKADHNFNCVVLKTLSRKTLILLGFTRGLFFFFYLPTQPSFLRQRKLQSGKMPQKR